MMSASASYSHCVCSLLFILLVASSVAGEASRPENIAAVVGDSWQLTYQSSAVNFFVNWYREDAKEKTLIVFNGTKRSHDASFNQRVSTWTHLNGSTLLHTFQVVDTVISDSGRYTLEDILASPVVEVSVEVIILEHPFNCSVWPNPVEARFKLTVSCSTVYHGRWGPVLDCYSQTLNDPNITGSIHQGISAYNYTGTPAAGIPRDNVTCWGYFDSPTTEEYLGMSMNKPMLPYTWMAEFQIFYPATNISISSNQTEHDVGDVITCRASGGNPAPTYQWVDSVSSAVTFSNTATLTVTRDMAGEYRNVTCIATTKIGQLEYRLSAETNFFINPIPETTSITTTTTTTSASDLLTSGSDTTPVTKKEKVDERLLIIIIVGAVAALLAIILIIVIIVCCVKKGKCKRRRTDYINTEIDCPTSVSTTMVCFNNGTRHGKT